MCEDEVPDDGLISMRDAWEHYYSHSGSASSNARKLAFTGIALIWIFSGGGLVSADEVVIHGHFEMPLALLILALAVDLAQYVYLAGAWRWITWSREHKGLYSERFLAPTGTNFVGELFFAVKIVLVSVGFIWLLVALAPMVLG